jgi:NADH:ubiquinone oxidoreductase subunit 3 (subunit A)
MKNIREKVTFYLSALLYLVFNLRIGADFPKTAVATGWQILQTAPFIAGFTYLIISILQYMGDGSKLPWDRRLRLFFAIGIIAGLVFGIWEYAGVEFDR